MVKLTVKKNAKPKTKKTKTKSSASLVTLQKQSQKVVVNIGNVATKRKRLSKKVPQKVPQIPMDTSPILPYNKPSASLVQYYQPSSASLVTSLLSSQNTPSVAREELNEQTSLRKAISEQNTQTDEAVVKTNDLERVRSARLKKFEEPTKENTQVEINSEEPVRKALFGQVLSNQQDDTEKINALKPSSSAETLPIPFVGQSVSSSSAPLAPAQLTTGELSTLLSKPSKYVGALRGLGLGSLIPSRQLLLSPLAQRGALPFASLYQNTPPLVAEDEVGPLQQSGVPNPFTTSSEEIIVPTPLTLPSTELGFAGLTEEVQTNVGSIGEFLPAAPVSQVELLRRQQQEVPTSLLEVRPPDVTITERLVQTKGGAEEPYYPPPEPKPEAKATPIVIQAEVAEATVPFEEVLLTRAEQIKEKWDELRDTGLLKTKVTKKNPKQGGDPIKKSTDDWLSEIRTVVGYESWKAKKKSKPVEAIQAEEYDV